MTSRSLPSRRNGRRSDNTKESLLPPACYADWREIGLRGGLDVLRSGVKDSGGDVRLACFRPVSGLNEELRHLDAANIFAEAHQLCYSEKGPQGLDMVLCHVPVRTPRAEALRCPECRGSKQTTGIWPKASACP